MDGGRASPWDGDLDRACGSRMKGRPTAEDGNGDAGRLVWPQRQRREVSRSQIRILAPAPVCHLQHVITSKGWLPTAGDGLRSWPRSRVWLGSGAQVIAQRDVCIT